MSTDPFPGYRSIPSTMHPYNYCGNNPINFVDPLGLWEVDGYSETEDDPYPMEGVCHQGFKSLPESTV